MQETVASTQTPYSYGYQCALLPANRPHVDCPYPKDTPEYDEWWNGYCDATDDLYDTATI